MMQEWMIGLAWLVCGIPGAYLAAKEGNPPPLVLLVLCMGLAGTFLVVWKLGNE